MFTDGKTIGMRVNGLSRVDPSPSNKIGASGRGGTISHLKIPEAEALYEAFGKMLEEVKGRK